jgi:NAD-dependent DNA ligase
MDIQGLAAIVAQCWKGVIHDDADLYYLKMEDLLPWSVLRSALAANLWRRCGQEDTPGTPAFCPGIRPSAERAARSCRPLRT